MVEAPSRAGGRIRQTAATPALSCRDLSVGYGAHIVTRGPLARVLPGSLDHHRRPQRLRQIDAFARARGAQPARSGAVFLRRRALQAWPRRERARRLAWLAQSLGRHGPDGGRGGRARTVRAQRMAGASAGRRRCGHAPRDDGDGLARLGTAAPVDSLRRRASASASRPHAGGRGPVMLLDEPTTHLDPPHQEDIVRLLARTGARLRGQRRERHPRSLARARRRPRRGARLPGLIGHGTIADALAGDWLSAAFETPVHVVEHAGVHLWRPSLEPPLPSIERSLP